AYLLNTPGAGDAWGGCLASWSTLEKGYRFRSPKTGLSARGRPNEVQFWVSRARPVEDKHSNQWQPVVKDGASLEASFWKWWTAINPPWRKKDSDGRFKQEGSGTWDALVAPGKNGFLSVLVCLKWWHTALAGGNTAGWDAALRDVAWVLASM
ncbi:hypothetical protein PLICRDRAFT_84804, partial [Plicaturopsis crispa FD-325 SS-3]